MQYDMQHLRALRLFELNRVLEYLPPRGDVLEVGAGAGWQSEHLCSLGYEVEAVDLGGSSIFESERSFPIRTYDGHTLPFPDDSFDAIFSSNVLEHVPHIEALLPETARVLRPGGHAVHVLPTSAWRLWTLAAHYPAMAKQAGVRLAHRETPPAQKSDGGHEPRASSGARLSQVLLPARHGEQGNAVSEVRRFSRTQWGALFQRTGWSVRHTASIPLLYTGYSLIGARLPIPVRSSLSRLLGAATCVFVLTPSGSMPAS